VIADEVEYEVEKILRHRFKGRGRNRKVEFLVLWKGFGVNDCTWEPEVHLSNAADLVKSYW
jgi:Chromo (CHRromatin Organisation MOdifier) domain